MLRAINRPVLAFFDALKNLRIRQLALILKAGFDPNLMVNARGQNGLQYMINHFGATEAHFRLQTPMNKAAYLSIAKLLLDSGLDPNTADLISGETVIFEAIRFHDKDLVALLLNYADFSLRNKDGETALMCAARFGTKQVMRLILEHLQSLHMDAYFLRQRNRFGLTALELARAENLECAKLLTKHLIAFGPQANAVLNRSSSYHQLLPRTLPYHLRAGRSGQTVTAAAAAAAAAAAVHLYDEDSASDLEAELLANPYQVAPAALARQSFKSNATGALPFYDSRAAEFNQYLLEQQDSAGASSGQQHQQQQYKASGLASWSGDEEDYFGGSSAQMNATNLTRSRSCAMLNHQSTATSKQQAKYGNGAHSSKKNAANAAAEQQAAKMASSTWEPSGSGAAGRSAIN